MISPRASASGLPCSLVSSSASSSACAICRSNHLRRIAERSLASSLLQVLNAFSAASMACLVSAVPRRGTLAISSPVAGLVTGISGVPTHLPSMKHWFFRSVMTFLSMGILLGVFLEGMGCACQGRDGAGAATSRGS